MEKLAYGGVSPRPCQGAVRGVRCQTRATGLGRFSGFTYYGGPVLAQPEVYTSYWGTLRDNVAHQVRAERLDMFVNDLLRSGFMNVLSQYGIGPGQFAARCAPAEVPRVLTDADIRAILQHQIDSGALPEPPSSSEMALLIYLDENTNVHDTAITLCSPTDDAAFGYHSFFVTSAGNSCHYAVIPAITDICVRQACPNDENCSLRLSQTQEQRQTQVTSHVFAEMATNPQFDAWFDPDPDYGESGDICNGDAATLTIRDNIWTVQRIYSKQNDLSTNGAIICAADAPIPLLPLI